MSLLWRRRRDLHVDQIHAIQGLSALGKYLLLGPPGSGKTSILLHRGQYLRLPPHQLANTVLVTFSRTLREFISLSGDDRFPPELIVTQKTLLDTIFRAYAEKSPTGGRDLDEQNRIRAEAAIELLNRRGRIVQYDAILVDEIQDLNEAELRLLGMISDRVMFVGDIRQQVYRSSDVVPSVSSMCDQTIELRHHFRISQDICEVADRILVNDQYSLAEYAHYVGPAPSRPSVAGPMRPADQVASLAESLDLQIDTYNDPADMIGVVVGRTEECDDVFEILNAVPKFAGRCGVFHSGVPNRRFDENCKICITTVQSCKGLEFRALHWLFADATPYLTRQKAYTVVTRAKSSLTLYRENALPAILAGAIPPTPQRLFDDDE